MLDNPDTLAPAASATLTAAVEERLTAFVHHQGATLTRLDAALEPLVAAACGAVLNGGKRLRPHFAYWGWRAAGGDGPLPTVLPALAALELLHAFALVHDDVMDRSALRRGRPSAHRVLAEAHVRAGLAGDPERFGDSAAILVGDLCLVWADRLMAEGPIDRTRLAAARHVYDDMRIEAIAGQFLDILGEQTPEWTVDQAMRTVRLKTAAYTVVRPLQFGAALAAPVDCAVSRALTRFGTAIGEAFQLRDDLLGAFGDVSVTGKPAGDDLVQGKPTVLLQLARARANADQRAQLERLLQRTSGHVADGMAAHRLADLVRSTGAPAVVESMITRCLDEASRVILTAEIGEDSRSALVGLAWSVARRSA